MTRRTYTLNGLNREALHAQLAATLPMVYAGFADHTTRDGVVVTVNLNGAASVADINQLNSLMAAYDPTQRTPEQQARQDRQQKLTDVRRDYRGDDLKPADYSSEPALIQTLARKIAWLEQEIADLQES